MTGTASDSERHLVVFSLHGEQYALPVAMVREIIRYVAPSATATASGLIRGMISLRGQVLPIVDLSIRLGRTLEIADGTRILVIELERGSLGLIVDRVDGVRLIPMERIERLPVAADDGLGDEIAAIDDRLIILLDAERALGSALPEPPRARPAKRTTARQPKPAPPRSPTEQTPARPPAKQTPARPPANQTPARSPAKQSPAHSPARGRRKPT
jgi:purine-binding chemotaxis protein CheW